MDLRLSNPKTPHTLANLTYCENLPEVICLVGLHNLQIETIKVWIETLEQWAQLSQQQKNVGNTPSSICIIASAERLLPILPESNLFLSLQWWWGIPSVLETRFLCRFTDGGDNYSLKARWREYILPSVSLGDISLLGILWDSVFSSWDILIDKLNKYALDLNWKEKILDELEIQEVIHGGNHFSTNMIPPSSLRNLWSMGVLQYTPEYGLEVHSAALTIMGQTDVIRHRLWRGQSEFMLPTLESLRLEICQKLTDQFGSHWPLLWDQPKNDEELEELQENPLATSWGYLVHLLRTAKPLRNKNNLLPVALECRKMRNYLAHHRTVEMQDYEYFQREIICLLND
jgi:hypothetical protein